MACCSLRKTRFSVGPVLEVRAVERWYDMLGGTGLAAWGGKGPWMASFAGSNGRRSKPLLFRCSERSDLTSGCFSLLVDLLNVKLLFYLGQQRLRRPDCY